MKTRILRVIVPVICLLSAAAVFAQENTEGPFTQFANRLQWENARRFRSAQVNGTRSR